jgi:hypothetical protein
MAIKFIKIAEFRAKLKKDGLTAESERTQRGVVATK